LRQWPRSGNFGSGGGGGGGESSVKKEEGPRMEGLLKNAEKGKVCTRFPPEPSGYLHIGHAKAVMLNNYYARHYDGKLIIRFDDTNPSKEKMEFEESIMKDLKTLNIFPDQVSHTSDYFDKLQSLMEQVIKNGDAYCDDTDVETMRSERDAGTESKCRSQPLQENLRRWQEMLKGSEEGKKNCVRGRMDMQCLNKCLRDPVFYRCKTDVPHAHHGFKYKAYPTYDFACPSVDSIEGITHALRTIEYKDRDEMYKWVQEKTKSRKVEVVEFSKTQFSHTVLSKRKLAWFVENGKVEGWNDPRFPTVQGILRRGMRVDALSEFVVKQGMSKATNLMEWDQIWAINKQKIDPIVPRFAAVTKDGAVPFSLSGIKGIVCSTEKRHPKNEELGERLLMKNDVVWIDQEDAQDIASGEELTLLHWGNAFADKIEKDKTGNVVKISGRLNPEGIPKTTKKKIHWVPKLEEHVTELTLREFDHLMNKEKIEDDDNMEDIVNPCSVVDTVAIGDPVLKTLQKGESIQLERRGYYIVDSAAFPPGKPMVLLKIPDGKSKDMGMKSKVDPSKLQGGSADKDKKKAEKAEASAKAAPKAAAASGGGVVDEAAVKAVGDEIRVLKDKLKGEGVSGKKINEHADVVALVAKLNKLKEGGPAPAAAAEPAAKKDAKPKAQPAAKAGERPIEDVTRLNIKVGKITKCWAHESADKLWCEEIDVGEAAPRSICSGLRAHVKQEEMQGAMVVVLCNLKSRKMQGFESQGMVMCGTSSAGKVELLHPPAGAKVGERIAIEGLEMLEPDDKLNEKTGKAPFVVVQPGFSMNGNKQATYKGAAWMTSAGPVTATTLTEGTIS
jgi:glutamyl-tRNA synthetase